jgi:DNA-binding CsgD family transcriptional regulator
LDASRFMQPTCANMHVGRRVLTCPPRLLPKAMERARHDGAASANDGSIDNSWLVMGQSWPPSSIARPASVVRCDLRCVSQIMIPSFDHFGFDSRPNEGLVSRSAQVGGRATGKTLVRSLGVAYGDGVLVGRARECARIGELLDAARRKESGALVLAGESGMGKTALLEWASAAAVGLRVVTVRASETEASLPYAALTQLLQAMNDEVERLASRAEPLRGLLHLDVSGPADRFVLGVATLRLLTEAAANQPVLIVIDDAHWLDVDSAAVILFAARRLDADAVGLLMSATAADLARVPGLAEQPQLAVTGLGTGDIATLVYEECGQPPAKDLVEVLFSRTAGNPFAVREVAQLLTPQQLTGLEPLPTLLPAPQAAQRLFEARCRKLGGAARACLGLLALADGEEVGVAVSAAASLGTAAAQLDQLEDDGLVSFSDGTVRFAHPLLRWAAETQLTASEHRRTHAAIANALCAPHLAHQRAAHRAASVLGYDDQIGAELEGVATAVLQTRGYAAASSILRDAAQLTPPGPARASRLHAAAELARQAGRGDLAALMLAEARDQADIDLRVRVDASLGQLQIFSGQPRQALRTLRAAADAARLMDPALAASSLADASVAALLAGRLVEAVALAYDACAPGTDADDSVTFLSDVIIGSALLHLGDVDGGIRNLRSAEALARRRVHDPYAAAYIAFAGLALLWTGDHLAAGRILEPLVTRLRSLQALGILPFALYAAAHVDLYVGRLMFGYAKATEAADLAKATGDHLWRYMATGCLALAEALRGDQAACVKHSATAAVMSTELDLSYPRDGEDALGVHLLASGDAAAAAVHLAKANRPNHDKSGPVLGRPSSPDFVEAATRAGIPLPDNIHEEIERQTTGGAAHGLAADAWRCRALLDPDPDRSSAAFHTAIELYVELQLPLREARTRLTYGETLRRLGARSAAREQLRVAVHHFDELGALHWAERGRRELRATGERTVPPSVTSAPLTGQEFVVAHVVARGATNKEAAAELFLSTKTIEMHLSRIYSKLGVRSRTELANQLAPRGPV